MDDAIKFKSELKEFLKKWGAELSCDDHYSGYPECGEDVRITATMPTIYKDGEEIRPYTEIDLGKYFH